MENRKNPLPDEIADDPKLFGAHLLRAAIQEGEKFFQPIWYIQPNVPETHLTIANFQMHTRAAMNRWLEKSHPEQEMMVRRGNLVLDHIAFLMTVYGVGRLVGHLSVSDPIVKTRDHLRIVRGGRFRSTYPRDPATSRGAQSAYWKGMKVNEKSATRAEQSLARFLVGKQQPNVPAAVGPIADMINDACTHLLHPHESAVTTHASALRAQLLSFLEGKAQMDNDTRKECFEAIVSFWNEARPQSVTELDQIRIATGSNVDPASAPMGDIYQEYLFPLYEADNNALQERMPMIGFLAIRSILEEDDNLLDKVAQLFLTLSKKHGIALCDFQDSSAALLAGRIMEGDSTPSVRSILSGEGRSDEWT